MKIWNNDVMEALCQQTPDNNFPMQMLVSRPTEETRYWDFISSLVQLTQTPVCYFEVPQYTHEAYSIANILFSKTKSDFKIKKVERIQNPFLMCHYMMVKDNAICCYGSVNVRWVLHGTKEKNIHSIATTNFDLQLAKRHRYGKGIYFTTNTFFATKFSDRLFNKALIIANVIEGKSCWGHENMVAPNPGCDTSIAVTPHGEDVIVKYEPHSFYPAYRVQYTSDLI